MLRWLVTQARTDDPHVIAIGAIVEQHRDLKPIRDGIKAVQRSQLEAIRAFVERVEKRPLSAAADFQDGVYDELAAMSKEAGGVDERDR